MLAYARRRAGGKSVQWVPGDSRDLPGTSFDLAVMTGNVAQHIPDPDWMHTLKDVRQRMGEGGVVAFESRNPAVRAWTTWTSQKPTTRTTSYGLLREWHEATEVSPGIVELTRHRFFENTNDHVAEKSLLVFRERSAIENQLASADFRVEAVYGDWHHSSFTVDAPLMVFVARAA
jgi:SAM-dependent methyltransferase